MSNTPTMDGVIILSTSESEAEPGAVKILPGTKDVVEFDSETSGGSEHEEGNSLLELNKKASSLGKSKRYIKYKPLRLRQMDLKEPSAHSRKRTFWLIFGCSLFGFTVLVIMLMLYSKMREVGLDQTEAVDSFSPNPIDGSDSQIVVHYATDGTIGHLEETDEHKRLRLTLNPPLVIPTTPPIFEPGIAANRVDCHPDPGVTMARCSYRKCVWDPDKLPSCYYSDEFGYKAADVNNGRIVLRKAGPKSPFSLDVPTVKMTYEHLGPAGILHYKFENFNKRRYEVPIDLWPYGKPEQTPEKDKKLALWVPENMEQMFRFQIFRNGNAGTILWNTRSESLVFSDQYLQISTKLPSSKMFGFGENTHQTFLHNFTTYKTWSLFASGDNPKANPVSYKSSYGVHPFYLCIEDDGKAHGVLFLNSNAQDYTTGPDQLLTYRTTGGILDFYMFPGPKPQDVLSQYWSLIGRPFMPPYWSLGFQLCRYGYKNLDDVRAAVDRTKAYNIPHDVQYVDIDYMDGKKDFTVDPVRFRGLPEYVHDLQRAGMHWIFILDPGIGVKDESYLTFTRGKDANVFITWPNGSFVPAVNSQYKTTDKTLLMLGLVWPEGNVVFPDFLRPNTSSWWANELKIFKENVLNFDGIWIDMNEPTNFHTNDPNYPKKQYTWYHNTGEALVCPDNKYESPPYKTGAVVDPAANDTNQKMSSFTLCMIAEQFINPEEKFKHYDVHSLYGHSEAKATHAAVEKATSQRPVVLSRSTFASSGQYAGHWLGDNAAAWEDMRVSIIGVMEFSMFGIPYVGADICGFGGNTTEELCLRWMQLGAFYPFSRNHNSHGAPEQDPGIWHSVGHASKKALEFRYQYLPHLNTLFFYAHLYGNMSVVNPLVFEFPLESLAALIDKQFLWGTNFMISPVLYSGHSNVEVYFPDDRWYSLYEHNYSLPVEGPRFLTLPAPLTSMIPVHIRGGSILPRQAPANNTEHSRKNPLELLVAIGRNSTAFGNLFWDDGIQMNITDYWHLKFEYSVTSRKEVKGINEIRIFVEKASELHRIPSIDIIEIFGLNTQPLLATFKLNGVLISEFKENTYDRNTQRLLLQADDFINMNKNTGKRKWVLEWFGN